MKLQKSTDQIIISQSGIANIIGAIVVGLFGLALAIISLLNKAPMYVPGIGLLLILLGGFIGWSAQSTTTTLNKLRPSTVTTKRLIGGAASSREFNTTQVSRVELLTSTYSDPSMQAQQSNSRQSTLKLVLNDNTEITLGASSKGSGVSVNGISMSAFRKAPLSAEAQEIADFLGVPLGASDLSNPVAAVQSLFQHPQPSPTPVTTAPPVQPAQVSPLPIRQPDAPQQPMAASAPYPTQNIPTNQENQRF